MAATASTPVAARRPASFPSEKHSVTSNRTGRRWKGFWRSAVVHRRRVLGGRCAQRRAHGLVERLERRVQAHDGGLAEQHRRATSSSRTSSQIIALGVRAAFGDTPSATVGESWYGAHTTLSNQAGRRRAAFCYPTNAAVLYDRVQDRPSDAGARYERSSPSRRAGSVSPTS